MASITREPNGRKRIQFVASDGRRKSVRLGKCTERQALTARGHIEQLLLVASGVADTVDDKLIHWLAKLSDEVYGRLAAVGLVADRQDTALGEYLDAFITQLNVKPGTATFYGHTCRNLRDFFGDSKPLREISKADAHDWRQYLAGEQNLSENTVRRRCGAAKTIFRPAVRRNLINSNPFEELKAAVRGNPKKYYFISREEAAKVLDACPDAEWRLIFALSRFGGLRCPSEHLALRWEHVDWERGRSCFKTCEARDRRSLPSGGRSTLSVPGSATVGRLQDSIICKLLKSTSRRRRDI